MTESVRPAPSANEPQTHLHEHLLVGLDWLDQGLTLFDTDLRLMAWNRRFLQLLDFPESLPKLGTPFEAFITAGVLYLMLSLMLVWGFRRLERHWYAHLRPRIG